MESAQPLKYKIYVHLKNGGLLESPTQTMNISELDILDKWLSELGEGSTHTLSFSTEIGKCYIPIREILYVEVIEDA